MNNKAVLLSVLTAVSTVSFVLICVFTGLAVAGVAPFHNTLGGVSEKYPTEITPANYTFLIWNVIFLMQALWIIYALTALCRKNSYGPVYLNPVVLPTSFHASWIMSCGFFIVWLFAWDREEFSLSFVMLLLLTACGYVANAVQGIATAKNQEKMQREAKVDLILVYVLVQNGTDLLYAWTTVATLLNFSMVLTYETNLSDQTGCLICLSILLVLILFWSVFENTVFFNFFKFIYTWYAVLIWATVGILVNNFDISNPNTSLAIVILLVASVCLVIKIIVYMRKKRKLALIENESL